MTALEVLKQAGLSETVINGMDPRAAVKAAKAINPNWTPPPTEKRPSEVHVELTFYAPKAQTKSGQPRQVPGMYLKATTRVNAQGSTYGGVFHRLCDGNTLTAAGKTEARKVLSDLCEQSAALLENPILA